MWERSPPLNCPPGSDSPIMMTHGIAIFCLLEYIGNDHGQGVLKYYLVLLILYQGVPWIYWSFFTGFFFIIIVWTLLTIFAKFLVWLPRMKNFIPNTAKFVCRLPQFKINCSFWLQINDLKLIWNSSIFSSIISPNTTSDCLFAFVFFPILTCFALKIVLNIKKNRRKTGKNGEKHKS